MTHMINIRLSVSCTTVLIDQDTRSTSHILSFRSAFDQSEEKI